MVKPCNCSHAFQDAKYGKGMRVHTVGQGAKSERKKTTCTVCGTVKEEFTKK